MRRSMCRFSKWLNNALSALDFLATAKLKTSVPPRGARKSPACSSPKRGSRGASVSLAGEIERGFRGREMVVVSLFNGTIMFLPDLQRHLSLPLGLDSLGVSSYGAEAGKLIFATEPRLDVRGRDVETSCLIS